MKALTNIKNKKRCVAQVPCCLVITFVFLLTGCRGENGNQDQSETLLVLSVTNAKCRIEKDVMELTCKVLLASRTDQAIEIQPHYTYSYELEEKEGIEKLYLPTTAGPSNDFPLLKIENAREFQISLLLSSGDPQKCSNRIKLKDDNSKNIKFKLRYSHKGIRSNWVTVKCNVDRD